MVDYEDDSTILPDHDFSPEGRLAITKTLDEIREMAMKCKCVILTASQKPDVPVHLDIQDIALSNNISCGAEKYIKVLKNRKRSPIGTE